MEPTQADRRASISTPLGDDKLLLQRFSGHEQLGRMFKYELELLSPDPDIKLSDLLGHPVTISMAMPDDGTRFFNGFVTSFAMVGTRGRLHVYNATVRPWLWFLTRTADSRIFPEKNGQAKVPDIIMGVFREHGFSDFDDQLQRSYKPREHCVQYRETDFNFVMRLMEDEGIYFWFKHEDGKHTMVLCDDYGSHEAIEGYEEVPCHPEGNRQDIEYLSALSVRESVQAGMVALNDYDFMRPKADLKVQSKVGRGHEHADYEMYDFPGEYVDPADGEAGDKAGNDDLKSAFEQVAKTRIEELHAQFESAEGAGNVRGLYAGGLFSLVEHPRENWNREYLIVSAHFELQSDEYGTGGGAGNVEFHCGLTAIDATTPFRSQRLTPKPTIQGIQTATVSGPSGEIIYTDKYGRVKLQFPWDRYGEFDESSSCWVRVSQNWAGPNWGGVFLPHVGQEVLVSFVEGDPDRPIVTGRVYNEDNMPADELPAGKTKSIIRDHGNNELVMEGDPGNQTVHIQQDCGNKMLFDGTGGAESINVKDCGDNEMNMQAHDTKEVFIKQACGNEIVMNEEEGITLRDKYGNEIVMDAANGFMRLASPTHNSFIELGKSINWNTDSDNKSLVSANATHRILGETHTTYGGSKTEVSLSLTLATTNGVSVKRYWAYENHVNYKGRNKRTKGAVTADSDTNYHIIGGFDDASQLELDSASLEIRFDNTDQVIKLSSSGIDIKSTSGGAINIESTAGDITLKTTSGDIKLDPSGKVLIPKKKLDAGWIKE